MIKSNIVFGRLRLTWRWLRFISKSIYYFDFDFVLNSLRALILLLMYRIRDFHTILVECNICGWQGAQFYPNVGPGYFEKNTTCPACLCQDRHRSLIYILEKKTDFFQPKKKVLEVAPMRSFEQYCRERKQTDEYTSFDFERYAMERGDITNMSYQDDSYNYFLCLHVMEHIREEKKALDEIYRVLQVGGIAIFQVPLNEALEKTVEYKSPRRRETNHVRMYGQDFIERIAKVGFKVSQVSMSDIHIQYGYLSNGFDNKSFYFAQK